MGGRVIAADNGRRAGGCRPAPWSGASRGRWGRRLCAVALLSALPVLTAQAGGVLSVRLVEAHNRPRSQANKPFGMSSLLESNLPYKQYDLLQERSMSLPASGAVTLREFSVRCSGPQNNLKVTILRNGKVVLDTTLSLRDGKPVFLGGFPSQKGKLLIALVAG